MFEEGALAPGASYSELSGEELTERIADAARRLRDTDKRSLLRMAEWMAGLPERIPGKP
jgi:hypothetical protein